MLLFLIFFCTETFAGWNNEYSGTIGNLKIGMTLRSDGQNISGEYFYDKWLRDIPIKGNIDNKNNVVLYEYDCNGNIIALFKGRFFNCSNFNSGCGLVEGVWSKADESGSKNFKIELIYSTYYKPGKGRYYVAGFDNDVAVEVFVQQFWKAVNYKDKNKVADMIYYPISVFIDGKNVKIKNKAGMIKNYNQIFYSDFCKKIKNLVPHHLFAKYSGIMLGNGEIWFRSIGKRIKVVAINNKK